MRVSAQLAVIPRAAIVLVTLLVLTALVAGAVVVGSQPAPVGGPPANGLIAFGTGGDIWVVEPDLTGRRAPHDRFRHRGARCLVARRTAKSPTGPSTEPTDGSPLAADLAVHERRWHEPPHRRARRRAQRQREPRELVTRRHKHHLRRCQRHARRGLRRARRWRRPVELVAHGRVPRVVPRWPNDRLPRPGRRRRRPEPPRRRQRRLRRSGRLERVRVRRGIHPDLVTRRPAPRLPLGRRRLPRPRDPRRWTAPTTSPIASSATSCTPPGRRTGAPSRSPGRRPDRPGRASSSSSSTPPPGRPRRSSTPSCSRGHLVARQHEARWARWSRRASRTSSRTRSSSWT